MSSENLGATGLGGRYAVALYDLADEAKAVDAVAADLSALRDVIAESDDLRGLVRSPIISVAQQAAAMNAVLTKAGAHDLVTNFVGVVARNRRLFALPDMISAFLAIHAEKRGEISARVISAKPLTEAQSESLAGALKQAVGADVAIEASVDSSLLGGLVVQVGSRMVDSSLRTKLQHLRLAMKGIG
ncbi:MAG: F0F1 ATP synthase subunit delta [Magnetospiraceae bacterium]